MLYIVKPDGKVIGPSHTPHFNQLNYHPVWGDYLYSINGGVWFIHNKGWISVLERDVPEDIRMKILLLGE